MWELQQGMCGPTHSIAIEQKLSVQVVSGNRAGAATILIDALGEYNDAQDLEGELQPTVRVKSLEECTEVLRTQFDLVRPDKM